MNTRDWIEEARKHTEKDPGLAVFMVRDLPATKEAGLTDLAWAGCKYNITSDEAADLLDKLEAFLKGDG